VLERHDGAAEDPRGRREPDRRVAARPADLQHLAGRLRRHDGEQEAAGGRRHLPRPLLAGDAAGPLVGVLPLKALQDGTDLTVEHDGTLTRRPSARTRPPAERLTNR
jgi:hypothetical protein